MPKAKKGTTEIFILSEKRWSGTLRKEDREKEWLNVKQARAMYREKNERER